MLASDKIKSKQGYRNTLPQFTDIIMSLSSLTENKTSNFMANALCINELMTDPTPFYHTVNFTQHMRAELNRHFKKAKIGWIAVFSGIITGLLAGNYLHRYLGWAIFVLLVLPFAISANAMRAVKCWNCGAPLWDLAVKGQSLLYPFRVSAKLKHCPDCGVDIGS